MIKNYVKNFLLTSLVLIIVGGTLTVLKGVQLAFDGPGLGNLTFTASELFKPIFIFKGSNGAQKGHSNVAMHKGYLIVPGAPDSGVRGGGFAAFDVSNPRDPKLVISKFDASTQPMREAHGFGFSSSYPGDYVVMQTISGIMFWDWTDIKNPKILSQMVLPGIRESDYDNGNWWISWQAPYVYVGGSSNGLYIIDAKDPKAPKLLRQIPKNLIGGFNVGTVFAVGNLLITAMPENGAIAVLDISNPTDPKLLSNITGPDNYSVHVAGNRIYGAGGDGRLYSYDFSDPKNIKLVNKSVVVGGKGGYLSYQDGYILMGSSSNMAKIDVRNDADLKVIGKGTSNISSRDEDFAMVLGNLVFVGNDHGSGSALIPHQTGKDLTGPAVAMVNPKNNALSQAVTSRIGVSMSDNIDLRTVSNATFIVRPVGGTAIPGKYSHMFGIINFCPDAPLLPNTVYEIVLPAGGIKDISGNSVASQFYSKFSTGNTLPSGPVVQILSSGAQEVKKAVSFEAKISGSTAGTISYIWNFGDGTPAVTTSLAKTTHVYNTPGHYIVKLEAKDNAGSGNSSDVQTIYLPSTSVQPVSSSTIIFDAVTNKVWNANPDNNTVTISDAATLTNTKEIPSGKHPRTLCKAPNGNIWVTNQDDATITIYSPVGNLVRTVTLPYASQPYGIVSSPDKAALYITLQATGRLLKLDVQTGAILSELPVGPHPRSIAVSSDSKRIFVTRFISPQHQGEVTEVDALTFAVKKKIILGPDSGEDTEASGRGIPNYLSCVVITPDGSEAWVTGKKDNTSRGKISDGQPLTFENTVRAITSRISLASGTELSAGRIDMDNRDSPTAIAFSKMGDYAFITAQGNNLVEVRDAYKGTTYTAIENSGLAPRGLVISPDGNRLFVHNFLSRSVSVFNIQAIVQSENNNAPKLAEINSVATEKLTPEVLRGKKIFYSADLKMTQTGYISCASCHVDGGNDGRNWDFSDRGEGIRNSISLNGRAGMGHGRIHWSANFDEIQDFENDIRLSFKGTGLSSNADFIKTTHTLGLTKAGLSPDLDALASYVTSLNIFDKSPHRNPDGSLTADAIRGKVVFETLNCGSCHNGPDFTDSKKGLLHDVGTQTVLSGGRMGMPLIGLDVPTLRDVWNTAPYLHDGSAATLYDVLITRNKEDMHGVTSKLSRAEADELVAYLKQIDNSEQKSASPSLNLSLSSPVNATVYQSGDLIPLSVTTDIKGISEVIYYANGLEIGRSVTSPYSLTWKGTSGVKYEIHAKALHNKLSTISPEVNISYKATGGFFFNSVTAKSASLYQIARDITPDMLFRTDRTHIVEEVISELDNAEIILSPNQDKGSSDINLLTIQLAQQGTVYVGFDPRATAIPEWLRSWKKTNLVFKTSDQDMILYEKSVMPGVLVLGGNNAAGSIGSESNYVVLGKPGISPLQARLTSPADGAVIPSGNSIILSASITTGSGDISRVDYYANNVKIGSSSAGPSYTFTWNSAPAGHAELMAYAVDKNINQSATPKIMVRVSSAINRMPDVTIKTPSNNSQFLTGNEITATVSAFDPEGALEKVDYYLNSTFIGSSLVTPYSYSFKATTSGNHVLSAIAIDKKGLCSEPSLEVILKVTDFPLDLAEEEAVSEISIAPNPASHVLKVSNVKTSSSTVNLISMEGIKTVLPVVKMNDNSFNIHISALSSGMYILEISHNGDLLRKKVVIE